MAECRRFIELGSTLQLEILLHYHKNNATIATQLQVKWKDDRSAPDLYRKPYEKKEEATNNYFNFLNLLTFKILEKCYLTQPLFSYSNLRGILSFIESEGTGGFFLLGNNRFQQKLINKINGSGYKEIFNDDKNNQTISNSQLLELLQIEEVEDAGMKAEKDFKPLELSEEANEWITMCNKRLEDKRKRAQASDEDEGNDEHQDKKLREGEAGVGGKKNKKKEE